MSYAETVKKIREIEAQTGVKVKIVRLRKGDANCRYPGCWRVRPVGLFYCCKDHKPKEEA